MSRPLATEVQHQRAYESNTGFTFTLQLGWSI